MNNDKMRKSEALKQFEEADNAGRFAGNDADARQARDQAIENIRQDAGAGQSERSRQEFSADNNDRQMGDGQLLDADSIRPGQGNMMEEEAQNINKNRTGADRLENDSDIQKARNKANQGIQEGRDTGTSDDRTRNSGSR